MPVSAGLDLGPYRITSRLGAGGMGEVWLAHDTRLGRDVAIKTIPHSVSRDEDLASRFEREARLLAALNHPGIASVYGYERFGDAYFIILEYVPGETLSEVIARGPMDIPEALEIAIQLAEAIEAAHARSIIHRDLKPGNIKITPERKLKTLDFGLAKALAPEVPSLAPAPIGSVATIAMESTKQGVILGTPRYMSPEQARGKPVDKQADIWSFGCVLFEMLTGIPAFGGETIADSLSRVLEREPQWSELPGKTPARVRHLLSRCLCKNQRQRLHDIADARLDLEEALRELASTPTEDAAGIRTHPWVLAVAIASTVAAVGLATWSFERSSHNSERQPVIAALLAPKASQPGEYLPNLAVSSEGTRFVFVGKNGSGTQLYRRQIESFEFAAIPGTDGAAGPFFSPDGTQIGFFAGGKLKRVPFEGGTVSSICDAPNPRGGSWGEHDTIVLAPTNHSGLSAVPAAGGALRELTRPDPGQNEGDHRLPVFLPDGRTVLFTSNVKSAQFDSARIEAVSLDGKKTPVLSGGYGQQYGAGYLVYAKRGGLFAVPFDLRTVSVSGAAAPVLAGVLQNSVTGSTQFQLSASGTLVYMPAERLLAEGNLLWVDRRGDARALRGAKKGYFSPEFSPDGKRLAVTVADGDNRAIWIADTERGGISRLTLRQGIDGLPVWTPDGRRIVFSSDQSGPRNLFWIAADGSGQPERLTTSISTQIAGSFTPDGRILLYQESELATGWDLWALPFDAAGRPEKPHPVLQTQFAESSPRLSPDGKWLAYVTDESGQNEVVVRPFPGPGAVSQISTSGGIQPVWARNGREIFFRQADRMFAVDISIEPRFEPGVPRLLFAGDYDLGRGIWNYDVNPRGDRFVMVEGSEQVTGSTSVIALVNWAEALRGKFSGAAKGSAPRQ